MKGREAFALDGAVVRYGGLVAASDVSLSIGAGEAVALVGPSGAGKTTLLRLLNGTVRPDAGSVRSLGRELATLPGRELRGVRARIAFVPQDFGLVPELRVIQNVTAGRVGRRGFLGALRDLLAPSAETAAAAHSVLERVGIPEKMYQRTSRLSGGQQQRVAVARALFQSPEALLADEPVSSVDPARARATMQLLTRLAREEGLTLVVSIHHVEIAREFFPRLVGMRAGALRFDRPTGELTDADFHALYDLGEDEMLADAPS